jgi:hypothetical protein
VGTRCWGCVLAGDGRWTDGKGGVTSLTLTAPQVHASGMAGTLVPVATAAFWTDWAARHAGLCCVYIVLVTCDKMYVDMSPSAPHSDGRASVEQPKHHRHRRRALVRHLVSTENRSRVVRSSSAEASILVEQNRLILDTSVPPHFGLGRYQKRGPNGAASCHALRVAECSWRAGFQAVTLLLEIRPQRAGEYCPYDYIARRFRCSRGTWPAAGLTGW